MPSTSDYEFTEEQNRSIGSLAYMMRGVGFFYALFGLTGVAFYGYVLVDVIRTFKNELSQLATWELLRLQSVQGFLTGIILMFLGVMLFSASGHFKNVVNTRGDDIAHLMTAIGRLRSAFRVLYVLIAVLLAAVVIFVYVPLVTALLAR